MLLSKTEEFIELCRHPNLEKIKNFLLSFPELIENESMLAISFEESCILGHVENASYLLNNIKYIQEEALNICVIAKVFEKNCQKGNLNFVKFYLNNPYLNKDKCLQYQMNRGLMNAVAFNHIEIMEYLLFSSNLKCHAKAIQQIIGSNNHLANILTQACARGALKSCEYILSNKHRLPQELFDDLDNALSSSLIHEHIEIIDFLLNNALNINIHYDNDKVFKNLIKLETQGNIKLLEYLILIYKIEETTTIKELCKNSIIATELFNKRKLIDILEKQLEMREEINKEKI